MCRIIGHSKVVWEHTEGRAYLVRLTMETTGGFMEKVAFEV